MKVLYFLVVLFLLGCSCSSCKNTSEREQSQDTSSQVTYVETFYLEKIADGLISPVGIGHAGDGSGRLFILEQPGKILILENGKILSDPFLDLNGKVVSLNNTYSEKGILGLAFHPDYKNNGRFFVYYSAPSTKKNVDNQSVITEFAVSDENRNKANPHEKIIIKYNEPESNHNGGNLAFGPDRLLYISSGDGGGAGDKHGKIGNAQDLSNLLGKILRIDIDKGEPYSIPEDNPFRQTGQKAEIYAYGLRNPWRFSFDQETGKLYAGDVGQNKYEEVDIIEKGKNYGWRYMEGFHVFDEKLKNLVEKPVSPIYEYNHDYGISIIGGYIYRGSKIKELQGCYVLADWNGKMRYICEQNGEWNATDIKISNDPGIRINSLGIDENGEIYVAGQHKIGAASSTGVLYKLVKK